ncbi:L,D-transpeptidase family protein [Piscinibacter sakaiensis]|uniref:L,D-transpeptidase family protein n=1 Tax=Piscinibacter sakaiensis TaxID=1547922 RepID=UPI003AB0E818
MSQGLADGAIIGSGQPDPSARRVAPARRRSGLRRKTTVLVVSALAVVLIACGIWQGQATDGAGDAPPVALATADTSSTTAPADVAEAASSPVLNAKRLDRLEPVVARGDELLAATSSTYSTADARLLRIYGLIATSQAGEAIEEAARLARDMPNFGLAQLVYADLLKTTTNPAEGFGAVTQPLRAEAAERLRDLVSEARARVVAAGQRPPAAAVPAQFVRIDRNVRHAIAVDVSKSRLYVFENTDNGLVLRKDYYSSVGKLGLAKQVEGDLRTPIGVYFGTGRIADSRLRDPAVEDRYGDAAIALNYPNHYDQLKGRTGSGIWLHGVPTSMFSRPPLATDGCVAVSNPDMLELTRIVERQETPILIAEKIEWVEPAVAEQRRAGFMKTFDAWKAARMLANAEVLQQFYASDEDAGKPKRAPSFGRPATIDGVSVVWWRDDRDIVVVTYSENSSGQSRPRQKRQYWLQNEGHWKVVFEGNLG